jgi:tetratricopeptide (TPR) repeat protein
LVGFFNILGNQCVPRRDMELTRHPTGESSARTTGGISSSETRKAFTIPAVAIVIAGMVWLVFGQTVNYPFVNFDDPDYVYQQPQINAGLTLHGIRWAFTHLPSPNWYPLTNISHMIEYQFYGANAGGYHLTNVILHILTAVLLFLVLRQMIVGPAPTSSCWRSAFTAALFAIHPLRVESVAWIVERKDVLSGLFFTLTLAAYVRYARKASLPMITMTSILFACGLMSKPMLVTTPILLLLLDYWPLRRLRNIHDLWARILEKLPLFVLSAACAVVTSLGIGRAQNASSQLPLMGRIANAFMSYVIYIWQMIWPVNLAVFYPQTTFPAWQIASAIAFILAMTLTVFTLRKSYPYLLIGWSWYLLMLTPVIGVIQINQQAHADRYTYLPQIGLYLLIVWSIADLAAASRFRRQLAGIAAIIAIICFMWVARVQATYWRDSETLWTHTIAVTKQNHFAHASLADLLLRQGRVREAISHCEEALRIQPEDADAENNLGLAFLQIGAERDAVIHLRKCLEIDPKHMNAEVNLAWLLATSPDASTRDGTKAVELAEDVARRAGTANVIVLRTLAAAYAETGRFSEAIDIAQNALQLALAQQNDALAENLAFNIASYRVRQPLRDETRHSSAR